MIGRRGSPAERAQRLVRCYPPEWRERYGDEFEQLLIDDIADRPGSWRRVVDVTRSGLLARAAAAGLRAEPLEYGRQLRASLAATGCAAAVFVALGVAVWSQLTIDWQWSAPAASATSAGMFLMSAALLAIAALAVLAALPLLRSLVAGIADGDARRLGGSVSVAAVGLTVLITGGVHFGHGWPGTGGHQWAERGLVPAAVARFCWADTLWITSYWVHPIALSSFPASELGWMALSPLALVVAVLGTTRTVRGLTLTPRTLRLEAKIGWAAAAAMAVFLAGAGSWVVSGGPGPRGLFRVGAIDAVAVTLMVVALLLAVRALERARAHGRSAA